MHVQYNQPDNSVQKIHTREQRKITVSEHRTPHDLQTYIDANAIQAELLHDIGETPTVPAAAAALGVEPVRIIKTLLFLVRRPGQPEAAPRPVVVISNGERRVEKKAIAAHFGVGQKQVKLAPPDMVLELLGFPAGGVPPFGHCTPLPVIVDAAVMALVDSGDQTIYGGGGDDRTMLKFTVDELLNVVRPEIVAVS